MEEYILGVLDFDLMFLTPHEFLGMYTDILLNQAAPENCTCQKVTGTTAGLPTGGSLKDKIKLYT